MFVAADDSDAKQTVAALIRDVGFAAFDTGTLDDGRTRQLQGTPAWNRKLDADQVAALLPGAPGLMVNPTGEKL